MNDLSGLAREAFWEGHSDKNIPSEEFAEAFFDGAVKIVKEIAEKV